MSAGNVALMWIACRRRDADRTTWLVLADALDEDGRHGGARLLREQEYVPIGGRVWPRRVPGWFLVYDPDAASGGAETFYGGGGDGTYFVTRWGMVVRGEERARELVVARIAALGLLGYTDPDFTIEPLDFGNLDADDFEKEELAEDISDRLVPW